MARKSAALRLSQSQTLLVGYTDAGLDATRGGRFIADMIYRLSRGKGLSKRMRDWLDSLIEEGVPTPKGDPAILAKIDAAIETFQGNANREWEAGVLADFRTKFTMGWDLSEKQVALLEKLLRRADDDASGANLFTPTADQRSDLEVLVKLYVGYNTMWKDTRPAVAKAVRMVSDYLEGNATIEEYHYNKLYKAMSSRLRSFRNPRFGSGDIGWVTLYDGQMRGGYNVETTRNVCTAITDAYISDRGAIVNDWLLTTGAVVTADQGQIGKRRG